MKYIFDNLIEKYQCKTCLGMWFHFHHDGNKAFYRLSPLAPEDCTTCAEIDVAIEKETLFTSENWVSI